MTIDKKGKSARNIVYTSKNQIPVLIRTVSDPQKLFIIEPLAKLIMLRKTSPFEDRGEIQRGVEFIELRSTPSHPPPNVGGGKKGILQEPQISNVT
jgi:hypothetical protein